MIGPACGGLVDCSDPGVRRIALVAHAGNPLEFEVAWEAADALTAPITFTTELTPTFVFDADALQPRPMAIMVTIRLEAASAPLDGITTPVSTPHEAVTVVGGGLGSLQFPLAAVADSPADLEEVLAPAESPIDVSALQVDWPSQAAVVLVIPSDLCPPILAGLESVGSALEPIWVNPGYLGCEQPLLSYTVIAAVDRTALSSASALRLPSDPTFFDGPVEAPIEVAAGDARTLPELSRPSDLESVQGVADLPRRGEAAVAVLNSGRPVAVVHHHDNTVSAIDLRSRTGRGGDMTIVRWNTSRYFIGRGVWDEYGRRVDGDRATDLPTYATRVMNGVVEIGQEVPTPAGSPMTSQTNAAAMADVALVPDEDLALLSLEEALALPVGTTAFVDISVVVGPEGAFVCHHDVTAAITPCPDGSPVAESYTAIEDARTVRFGPILATRTETGFTEIAPTGGSAGSSL